MIRGTTPTYQFTTDISLVDAEEIYVTFKQGNVKVEKVKSDCEVTDETLTTALTQAETLEFKVGGYKAQVQIRALLAGGSAVASNIMDVSVAPILKEGVI